MDKLKNNRGRTKPMEEMTEVEKLKAEMKILEAKNRQLEIENEFIKNIAYKLGDSNNNALIFETFDEATSLYRDCCSTSVIFSLLFEQNVYFLTCHTAITDAVYCVKLVVFARRVAN